MDVSFKCAHQCHFLGSVNNFHLSSCIQCRCLTINSPKKPLRFQLNSIFSPLLTALWKMLTFSFMLKLVHCSSCLYGDRNWGDTQLENIVKVTFARDGPYGKREFSMFLVFCAIECVTECCAPPWGKALGDSHREKPVQIGFMVLWERQCGFRQDKNIPVCLQGFPSWSAFGLNVKV